MITEIDSSAAFGEIFDTHCHYDDPSFLSERDTLFEQLAKYGVFGGIICGCDKKSSIDCIELAKKKDGFFAAVGFHPENLPEIIEEIDSVVSLLSDSKVVAVGEIGLDYHWDTFPPDYQKECFIRQLITAKSNDLPVIIHDRDAHADTLDIIKKHQPKGVVHCYSGSVESANEIIKCGMYIGVGGVVTFKNAKKCIDVVKSIPLERILLETDAPYLAPEPYRGKQNHSGMIFFTAQKIAEIKNEKTETVLSVCRNNARSLFGV